MKRFFTWTAGTMVLFACLLLFVTSCKAPKVIVQEKVVTRDSVIVLLRDTTVYVEIERGVQTDVRHITDTVFLENRFATAQAYVVDSLLFLSLIQKLQTLPFNIQYTDERYVSERDSLAAQTETVEVNRLTATQSFFITFGKVALGLTAAVILSFVLNNFVFKK